MSSVIEIRAPGAAPVRKDIRGETYIIGRKPRAGVPAIALPTANDMSEEHLIISFVRDRYHVALATGARLEPMLNGKAFRQAEIAFGDEVIVGATSLRFLGSAKSNAPSPIIVIAALGVLGYSLWSLFDDASDAVFAIAPPPAPALFEAAARCPYQGPQALGRAQELERAAMAHTERYGFDPHDGIAAADAYHAAKNCYTNAGDTPSAKRTETLGNVWQTKLEGRYQGHQLRLRVALDRHRGDHALTEVNSLTQLLRGHSGPYVNWLISEQRNLDGS